MAFKNKIKSNCCNSGTYEAPAYYSTTMKTSDGKEIPNVLVCLKCGCKCNQKL